MICGSVRPRSGSAAVGEMLSSKTEEQVGPSNAKLFDAQRSGLAPKNDAEIKSMTELGAAISAMLKEMSRCADFSVDPLNPHSKPAR